ncbi:MAG: hypothetical protein K1X47_10235 [Cyclobacteriaceae bacterium]|nr:hypothetical protein [Cyclobacteriaceae bacterium]
MKVVSSRLIGTRVIRAQEAGIQLFQIRNVLGQHRDALVDRVLENLANYVEYKFHFVPGRAEWLVLHQALTDLKRKDIDPELYEPLIRKIQRREEVKLANDYFFLDIDETLRNQLLARSNFAA